MTFKEWNAAITIAGQLFAVAWLFLGRGVATTTLAGVVVAACGFDASVVLYTLFGGLMVGSFIDSASRLVYYRIG